MPFPSLAFLDAFDAGIEGEDGLFEGEADGDALGLLLGLVEGDFVGVALGDFLGEADGLFEVQLLAEKSSPSVVLLHAESPMLTIDLLGGER